MAHLDCTHSLTVSTHSHSGLWQRSESTACGNAVKARLVATQSKHGYYPALAENANFASCSSRLMAFVLHACMYSQGARNEKEVRTVRRGAPSREFRGVPHVESTGRVCKLPCGEHSRIQLDQSVESAQHLRPLFTTATAGHNATAMPLDSLLSTRW